MSTFSVGIVVSDKGEVVVSMVVVARDRDNPGDEYVDENKKKCH